MLLDEIFKGTSVVPQLPVTTLLALAQKHLTNMLPPLTQGELQSSSHLCDYLDAHMTRQNEQIQKMDNKIRKLTKMLSEKRRKNK